VATRRGAAVLLQAIPELGIEYFLLNLVVAVVVGYFTYRNAESRGESGLLWGGVMAAASFFLSLVGFLLASSSAIWSSGTDRTSCPGERGGGVDVRAPMNVDVSHSNRQSATGVDI